jgi:hypothetical protein
METLEVNEITALTFTARSEALGGIASDNEYREVGIFANEIKAFERKIEGEMEPLVSAAHKSWKLLTEKRAAILDPLIRARKRADRLLIEYVEKKSAMDCLLAPTAPPATEGTSLIDHWYAVITDPAIIPREYLMVDEAKINKIVKAMKTLTNIPGVQAVMSKTIRRVLK